MSQSATVTVMKAVKTVRFDLTPPSSPVLHSSYPSSGTTVPRARKSALRKSPTLEAISTPPKDHGELRRARSVSAITRSKRPTRHECYDAEEERRRQAVLQKKAAILSRKDQLTLGRRRGNSQSPKRSVDMISFLNRKKSEGGGGGRASGTNDGVLSMELLVVKDVLSIVTKILWFPFSLLKSIPLFLLHSVTLLLPR